jgi:RimJ/RimL family protein N-acetyltransferase
VELDVYDFNPRAVRSYEKAGFRREGTLRQALFREGGYHDVYRMAVLQSEFLEG